MLVPNFRVGIRLQCLFGKDHIKNYYSHDGTCASVIRHLRLHGSLNDSIVNDIIYVISTSYLILPCVSLLCACTDVFINNNNNN